MDKSTKNFLLAAGVTIAISVTGSYLASSSQQVINTVNLGSLDTDVINLQTLTEHHKDKIANLQGETKNLLESYRRMDRSITRLSESVDRNRTEMAVMANTVERMVNAVNEFTTISTKLNTSVTRLEERVTMLKALDGVH